MNRIEAEGDRRHDAMANMLARPETLVDYLHHQLSWFEMDDAVRRMAERIIYSLDTNGYLKTPLEELLPPLAAEHNGDMQSHRAKQMAIAEEALSRRAAARSAGRRCPQTLKECLLLQLIPGMPDYDELRTLIENHLEDLENNRLPQISKKTGMSIEKIQEVWQELRKLKPKPGADFAEATVPSVTPDVFVERNEEGKYEVRLEDDAAAGAVHQPVLPQAVARRRHERGDPRIHQAQDQLGPMADRIDRTTPQHADPRVAGDRRSPNQVSRRRPGAHRAAQDAANRRQGGRPRDDGQPGG